MYKIKTVILKSIRSKKENIPQKIYVIHLDRNTKLAHDCASCKLWCEQRELHFNDPNEQDIFLSSFSSSRYFLTEMENMFSMFLLSYRNTCESLGEI